MGALQKFHHIFNDVFINEGEGFPGGCASLLRLRKIEVNLRLEAAVDILRDLKGRGIVVPS